MKTVFTMLLLTAPAFAQETAANKPVPGSDAPPAHIAALLAAADKARADSIAGFEKRIAEDGAKIRTLKTTAAKREAAKKVAELKDRLKAAKASDEWRAPRMEMPPKVGAIGLLPQAHIDRVISASEATVSVSWLTNTVRSTTIRGQLVVQPATQDHRQLVWVRGVSMKALIDGDELPTGVFHVTGTKMYETTTGAARTVLLLEPVDQAEIDKWRMKGK